MKNNLLFITFFFTIVRLDAQLGANSVINQFDTVYFNLGDAAIAGNYLELPVLIHSDDTINSLDFSLRFDLAKLNYDSLIAMYPTMSPLASYNPNDSTLRLTSFDLQPIPKDVTLLYLRFKLLTGTQVYKTDFIELTALLNGESCTPFVTESNISTSIEDTKFTHDPSIHIYPNPSSGILNITCSEHSLIQVFAMNGQLESGLSYKVLGLNDFQITDLRSGMYILKVTSPHITRFEKFTVIR